MGHKTIDYKYVYVPNCIYILFKNLVELIFIFYHYYWLIDYNILILWFNLYLIFIF